MNEEYSYEDRIEFVIALMTRDYAKARAVGDRLLSRGCRDADVIRALDILKRSSQREKWERSSPVDVPTESKSDGETSDITDGDDSDSADEQVDIYVEPRAETGRIIADGASRPSNDDAEDSGFKDKMHRVLSIRK